MDNAHTRESQAKQRKKPTRGSRHRGNTVHARAAITDLFSACSAIGKTVGAFTMNSFDYRLNVSPQMSFNTKEREGYICARVHRRVYLHIKYG